LQLAKTGVQRGALVVKLRNAAAQLAQLTDQSPIVLEQVFDGTQIVTTRGV